MRSYWTLFLAVCPIVFAQREDRLNGPIDSRRMVAISGRNPRTEAIRDEGALEREARVRGIGFRFKLPAERLAELEHLLQDQQAPASPRYHAWLTPEEFGDRFGLPQKDLARVRAWIEGQGFV